MQFKEKEKDYLNHNLIFVGLYHLDFKEGLLELYNKEKSRGYSVEK